MILEGSNGNSPNYFFSSFPGAPDSLLLRKNLHHFFLFSPVFESHLHLPPLSSFNSSCSSFLLQLTTICLIFIFLVVGGNLISALHKRPSPFSFALFGWRTINISFALSLQAIYHLYSIIFISSRPSASPPFLPLSSSQVTAFFSLSILVSGSIFSCWCCASFGVIVAVLCEPEPIATVACSGFIILVTFFLQVTVTAPSSLAATAWRCCCCLFFFFLATCWSKEAGEALLSFGKSNKLQVGK